MKTKRFSVEQIVAVLKEAEAGMPVAESWPHSFEQRPEYFKYESNDFGRQF